MSSSGNRSDLTIADWEFLYAEQILNVYLDHLQSATAQFATLMATVCTNALDDGADGIADACLDYAQKMNAVGAKVTSLSNSLSGKADAFIAAIDQEDEFLYGS